MPQRRERGRTQPAKLPPTRRASPRAVAICAVGVFAASLAVYLCTIIPTAIDQDSGELVAAAHVLGITHPTGYPLWTMLGRAFDLLPIGHTSAYRVALLSAVSAAAAAAVVCWLTASLTGLLLPAVFSGVAFAFWFPVWSQAVRAEVYGLAGLLFTLFVWALWRWDHGRSPRQLYWVALAAGFVGMHHRTAFLAAAPALAVAFWLTRPRGAKVWARAALAFAAPFLCYLYLPIRAAARPPMNWGNPDTLDRFVAHVFARQYSRWAFMNPLDAALQQAEKLLGEVLVGTGWPSAVLGIVVVALIVMGIAHWSRRRPTTSVSLLLGSVLLCVWVLEWGETSDLKVFLIPVGAVMAVLGGVGLGRAASLPPRRAASHCVVFVLGAFVSLTLLAGNWTRADQSDVWRHRDQWAAALSQMDENAIFIAEWDAAIFLTQYLQNVEGFRQDITLLRPQGLWVSWYLDLIPDPELRNAAAQCWRQIDSELDVRQPGSPGFWQGTALLAHRLARHYRGRRTVYALHGPVGTMLPAPPHFVGANENLFRLDARPPNPLRAGPADEPMAEFPGGVQLVSFELSPAQAQTGEIVEFRAGWRLGAPLPGSLFAVKLAPLDAHETAKDPPAFERWHRFQRKALLVQGFPVLYGMWGLEASPPDTHYEQSGKIIIPTNAPAGEYSLEVGYAQSYPPDYQHWTGLGSKLKLLVIPRPSPTNAP